MSIGPTLLTADIRNFRAKDLIRAFSHRDRADFLPAKFPGSPNPVRVLAAQSDHLPNALRPFSLAIM